GVDRVSGVQRLQLQLLGDAVDGGLGLAAVELDLAAQVIVRIDDAEHDVGVRHRSVGPAEAIACRPGARAGALRTNAQQAALIDPGDAAAAGADRAHVDLR